MIDPTVARLRSDIAERGEEILRSTAPGFEPQHNDVRGTVRNVATPDPLAVVAPEEARFIVLDREGRQAYSRDGSFVFREGQLTTSQGAPVLGYRAKSSMLHELRVPKNDVLLGRVENLHIERDGQVLYERRSLDPRTAEVRHERITLGTLALARFPAGTAPLRREGLERAPLGVEPHIGKPHDGSFSNLSLARHEVGTLDLNLALARLHDAYQQLDAVAAAQRATRDTEKTAMDLVK